MLAWWPVDPLWSRVYSPYQLIEVGTDSETGLTLIRAAGHYYQHIRDFSPYNSSGQSVRDYYDFPYKTHPVLNDVAIVGAGTGNDVAAALRAKPGHVDAIEIDPVILQVGEERHPEKPYQDPRVRVVNNDARTFLRNTSNTYDLIVYGLLDSHTLLSQGSACGWTFVYTIEGLREAAPARSRTACWRCPSPCCRTRWGEDLSDAPGCLRRPRAAIARVLRRQHHLPGLERSQLEAAGRRDHLELRGHHRQLRALDGGSDRLDRRLAVLLHAAAHLSELVPDHDRAYPAAVAAAGGNFVGEAPRFSHLSFFFLGSGFMLVETKGITEMGLTFGNTWQVIGIVFAGILIMAFIGNCLVQWLNIRRPHLAYLFLLAALVAGWLASRSGGFASTPLGRLELRAC